MQSQANFSCGQTPNSYEENNQFLSHSYTSKEEFVKEYKRIFHDRTKAKNLYIQILTDLEKSISEGNIDNFKNLSNFIHYISNVEGTTKLKAFYEIEDNPLILNNSVLTNLPIQVGKASLLPEDVDEAGHNAFYYAIRSGSVDILDILIEKWPKNLDNNLSTNYDELKLKNVLLSDEIEIFIETKLIDLRFFSKTLSNLQNDVDSHDNIVKRIDLVLKYIRLLKNLEVGERFLFIAKFIASNIHILKKQLKSTYARLPWEEIEFCLVCFISLHIHQQEINIFCSATLDKSKIINHLQNFALKLKDINLGLLPKRTREEVVSEIIKSCPAFKELYKTYRQIRDIYSLEKISNYIKLLYSADSKEKEGQLVIVRVLQVMGEHFKNTLESPKLSSYTSELLLLSLSSRTSKIIKDLRDSLSHAESLSKRKEIEENTEDNFFTGIQEDIKRIGNVITNILFNHKINIIRSLLKKMVEGEALNEIAEVVNGFEIASDKKDECFLNSIVSQKCKELVQQLKESITNKTEGEKELLFKEIEDKINVKNIQLSRIKSEYEKTFDYLKILTFEGKDIQKNPKRIEIIKFVAKRVLKSINANVEPDCFEEIANLSLDIYHSVKDRIPQDKLHEINVIMNKIYFFVKSGSRNIDWIEKFRDIIKLQKKNRKKFCEPSEVDVEKLKSKLKDLKSILSKYSLSNEVIDAFPSYQSDKNLQAVIEMLVLDIMSILSTSKDSFVNNKFYLDDNTPQMIGRCLRNHLAHDSAIARIQFSNPSTAVFLTANKLAQESDSINMDNLKNIGKFVSVDFSKLEHKIEAGLKTIDNQERMFVALEEGNLEELKNCMNNGADINARSLNMWTTLHFAAKGGTLEDIQFLLGKNVKVEAKDIDGRSPLHIAAQFGRTKIVEYFLKEKNLNVHDTDAKWKTLLHVAAKNGHVRTVKVLLNKEANTFIKDSAGFSAIHYAIHYNRRDVVNILLEKEVNANFNRSRGGYSLLHIASESGHHEIVGDLLDNMAYIDAETDKKGTPLHTAVTAGHLEVVSTLISKGANVNAKFFDDFSPLHLAARHGHQDIVSQLLKHKEIVVDVLDEYGNTPLHLAAEKGHKDVVFTLLKDPKNKANANAINADGRTPMHLAAMEGHEGTIDDLFNFEANINARNGDGYTPLHIAAESGHTEVVKVLVEKKANVNVKDNNDLTPLHLACVGGYESIIDLLIQNEAEVNARSNKRATPLHSAAISGHEKAVTLLIEKGAEVNARNELDITPLHAAAYRGHEGVIKLLISNGAEVEAEDSEGDTPLHKAVAADHFEATEVLLTFGSKINAKYKSNQTPLLYAVKNNNEEILKILIAAGAEVDNEVVFLKVGIGFRNIVKILLDAEKYKKSLINIREPSYQSTLLHVAAAKGHKEIVEHLIKKDPGLIDLKNTVGETALHFSAQSGSLEITKLLIDKGANINNTDKNGSKPIHIAAKKGSKDILEYYLIDKGLSLNDLGEGNKTLLHIAVVGGQSEVVKHLLEKGIDVNTKANGSTPLHLAVLLNCIETIEVLLSYGADYNIRSMKIPDELYNEINKKGILNLLNIIDELFKAVKDNNHSDVAEYIKDGAFVNAKNAKGETLLHIAAWKGNDEIVNILLQNKGNPNSVFKRGFTPLHYAAKYSHLKVVETLLSNGAMYNAASGDGKTPLDFAVDKNIIDLLELVNRSFKNVRGGRSEILNDINKVKDLGTIKAVMNARDKENKSLVVVAMLNNFSKVQELKEIFQGDVATKVREAVILATNGNCQDALIILKKIFEERKKILGPDNPGTLDIQHYINVVSLKQGSNNEEETSCYYKEALNIFRNVFSNQRDMWPYDAPSISNTLSNMAEVLERLGKYKEALNINQDVLKRLGKYKEALNINQDVLKRLNNDVKYDMAKVLASQNKFDEAFTTYNEVYKERKLLLGIDNSATLKASHAMAVILLKQNKYHKSLIQYRKTLNQQTQSLGQDHVDTLNTQYDMANLHFVLGKYILALKVYEELYNKGKSILGENHPNVLKAETNMKEIKEDFKLLGFEDNSEKVQNRIFAASMEDNAKNVNFLIKIGADVNFKDINGKTPLHYAADNVSIDIVNILIKNGADVIQVTNTGDTPLHIASKNGSLDMVKTLLKYGATYNIENREGKTPFDLAEDVSTVKLLKLVQELFKYYRNGNVQIINKLEGLEPDELRAVINARNDEGKTLIQVTAINQHQDLARDIISIAKN